MLSDATRSRLRDLQYMIDKVTPIVESQILNAKQSDSFGEHFMASFNEGSLRELKKELAKQQELEKHDAIVLKLSCENFERKTVRADVVGKFLIDFQKVIFRIAQGYVTPIPTRWIPPNIRKRTGISIQALPQDSYRLFWEPVIKKHTGNESKQIPSITDFGLIMQTSSKLFAILESLKRNDNFAYELEDLNPYAALALCEMLRTLKQSNLNVETEWVIAKKNIEQQYISCISVAKAYAMLKNYRIQDCKTIEFLEGFLAKIDEAKNNVLFKTLDSQNIVIYLGKNGFTILKSKGIRIEKNEKRKLQVEKYTYMTPIGNEKRVYSFVDII